MAGPTLIAFSEADSGSVTQQTITSATLTWQTGDILVAAAIDEGGANGLTFTISNTGSGLSWTNRIAHASSSDTTFYMWTAVATANSSGTVTATDSATAERITVGVTQWRAPTGTTIAVGNTHSATAQTTSPQVSALLMSSADSAVFWAGGDWSAGTVESGTPTPTTHGVSTPGPTASPFASVISTHYGFYYDQLDDEAATGTVNFGYSGSSAGPFAIGAVEIAISGPATPPTPSTLPAQMIAQRV